MKQTTKKRRKKKRDRYECLHEFCQTYNDDRSISIGSKVACLEDVAEIGGAGREDEAVRGHMSAAGGGQEHVSERLRVQQSGDGAVQMSAVAVPLELIIFRRGDGHGDLQQHQPRSDRGNKGIAT